MLDSLKRIRISTMSAVLLVIICISFSAAAQEAADPCKGLKTPQLIKEDYFERAKYKAVFPCLARMIESGGYKASSKVFKDSMFPVIDHYFANALNEGGGYELGSLLRLIMAKTSDEVGAKAAHEYAWSEHIKADVSRAIDRFYSPASIKITPAKATVRKKKEAAFTVTYLNREGISLKSLAPTVSSVVKPSECGTFRQEGTKIYVKCLKGGNKAGTLLVSDNKRKLKAEAQLVFSGRMSILWPIGGLAVTGGAAVGAANAEDGAATTLWIVTGVAGVATTYLFYKYFRGEGVPFLSKTDNDHSDGELAFHLAPGPASMGFNLSF